MKTPLEFQTDQIKGQKDRRARIDRNLIISKELAEYIQTHHSEKIKVALVDTVNQIFGRIPLNIIALQVLYDEVEKERAAYSEGNQ